ncbi:MAG TPA: hypothetical protein VID76_08675 [Solirubrobacterales bacterium]
MSRRQSTAIGTIAATIALAAVPAFAGAAARDYGPGDTDWTGSRSSEGLCVPLLLCPTINNSIESGTGAPGTGPGFIRTSLSSLTGVGATSIGTWQSAPFKYQGVDGKQATSLRLAISRTADVGQLLAVAGNTATYSVDLIGVSAGAGNVEVINHAPLSGADTWVTVQNTGIPAAALKLGSTYRVRISSRYETGATVIPGGSAAYDGVVLHARRATGHGNGNGGGADTADGLAKSGVAGEAQFDKHGRLRVKVRCSRLLEGACKIGLAGLVTRHGPKLTAKRHVRVKSGRTKVVTLRVKKRMRARLSGRRAIFARQTVRADHATVTGVKKLRLR